MAWLGLIVTWGATAAAQTVPPGYTSSTFQYSYYRGGGGSDAQETSGAAWDGFATPYIYSSNKEIQWNLTATSDLVKVWTGFYNSVYSYAFSVTLPGGSTASDGAVVIVMDSNNDGTLDNIFGAAYKSGSSGPYLFFPNLGISTTTVGGTAQNFAFTGAAASGTAAEGYSASLVNSGTAAVADTFTFTLPATQVTLTPSSKVSVFTQKATGNGDLSNTSAGSLGITADYANTASSLSTMYFFNITPVPDTATSVAIGSFVACGAWLGSGGAASTRCARKPEGRIG